MDNMPQVPQKNPVGNDISSKDIDFYHFSSEKYLSNKILKNIDFFMETVFDEEVESATDNKYELIGAFKINSNQLIPKRGLRPDLWIECKSGRKYIMEIKNPRENENGNIDAIGQLLRYAVTFPEATNYVIIFTHCEEKIGKIISRFSLPIDFVLITADQTFLLKK